MVLCNIEYLEYTGQYFRIWQMAYLYLDNNLDIFKDI